MARFTFKSLADPNNRRYMVSTDRLSDNWRDGNQFISDRVGWFETYGDGECQHCPTSQVLAAEMFTDFCASAATYLLEGGDEAVARILHGEIRSYNIHHGEVRKAMGIKYKEGKKQYVNRSDWKVSSSDSKRHDRRWEEVVSWMDGGYLSLVGLLRIGSGNFLRVYNELDTLRTVCYELTGSFEHHPWQVLEWLHWDYRLGGRADEAFHALRAFCTAVEAKEQAKRSLDCYVSNVENDKRLAAEAVAKVA